MGLPSILHDLMGNEVLKYFNNKPYLKLNVFGILDEDGAKLFLKLQKSIQKCTDEFNYQIKRIRGGNVAMIRVYLQKVNRDKIPPNNRVDPRSTVHKRWLNRAREHIKDVKENTNKFLSQYNTIGIDTLNFILQVESSVPFPDRGRLGNEPSPRPNSTIKLDSTYYEFDYFDYFITNRDTIHLLEHNEGISTWINRIN